MRPVLSGRFANMKYFLQILIVFLLVATAVWAVGADTGKELEVHFLDVGQGDAVLIITPDDKRVLVDGGPNDQVLLALEEVLPWHARRIDLMVLTHPHDDHVAGLNAVLDRFEVKQALYTGISHTAPAYLAWLKRLQEKEVDLRLLTRPHVIALSPGVSLDMIWPRSDLGGQVAGNLNNTSIVAKLIYGQNSFLLTGDIEEEVEADLLERGLDLKAQVLKTGHHGSDTSNTLAFINQVDPEYAVICVGDNNFGLPGLRVIRRYQRQNIPVLRTDKQGTISFYSNGNELKLKP